MTVCMGVYALDELSAEKYSAGERFLQEGFENHCPIFRLWPGEGTREDDPLKGVQEEMLKRINKVTAPSMMCVKPEKPDGRAVVLFPGGGYNILAAGHEGIDVAKWLNSQGITAFIVKYRCPRREGIPKHAVALQDAQRAIRLVRHNANKFGIKDNKIGVMGFSAGGHLSVLACNQSGMDSYEPLDEADKVSSKPDFAILIYPAYLWEENELDPMAKSGKKIDIPTYITIAADDAKFVKGSIVYALSLLEANDSFSLHVYPAGGHGGGLGNYPWPRTAEEWLKDI